MSDETALLPCPFCGGEAIFMCSFDGKTTIECINCRVSMDNSIAAWNTRAEMSYKDALILLDELGLSERTCRIVEYADAPIPVCSECGAVQPDDYAVYYCWSCGAKVVGE